MPNKIVDHGALIAEKLGVSQPTASEHMKILLRAGLVRAKRIKQWTFYKRDETSVKKSEADARGTGLDRKYFRTKMAAATRAGSTGKNEPSELSTENPVESSL